MADFLSAEWIEALDAAARAAQLPEAVAALSITVEQVVRDSPDGEACYHLRIENGRAHVQAGPAVSPDLRLFADYDIAVRIQRGEVNAQEALAAGRLSSCCTRSPSCTTTSWTGRTCVEVSRRSTAAS